jgi:flavin-dependent dehydrogenase
MAGLPLDEPLWIVSAGSSRLDRVWGTGWRAVGDAATAWDPLSGDGVHKALCEGTRAARAVAAHLGGDGDWLRDHAVHVVREYETYRARRDAAYGLDARWPDAPFWIRRRAAGRVERPSPQPARRDA